MELPIRKVSNASHQLSNGIIALTRPYQGNITPFLGIKGRKNQRK